jgi:hypothetical protein
MNTYESLQDNIAYKKGAYHDNLKQVIQYLSHNNTCNFDDWRAKEVIPNNVTTCACSHSIIQNNVIINKYNKNTLIVGSQCVKQFMPELSSVFDRYRKKLNGKKICPMCDRAVSINVVNQYPLEEVYHKSCYKKYLKVVESVKLNKSVVLRELRIFYNTEKIPCRLCNDMVSRVDLDVHNYEHAFDYIIPFGKYKSFKIRDVLNKDKRYLKWLYTKLYDSRFKDSLTLLFSFI